MAKFMPTNEQVEDVIEKLNTARKREDAYRLVQLYQKVSQEAPVVWYPSIIGFGHYRYQYESGHAGEAPLLAFSPRQARISLYIDQTLPEREALLARLGKHKAAVGCVYVNKLADIDVAVLEELLIKSLEQSGMSTCAKKIL